MSAAKSDAATSTEDIVKGRPLCLFYFAHPFGVLSCEPPTVVAPPAPAPSPAPAPAAAAMARRSPAWPAGACARRLPPYTRTLPPLRLPTPRDSSSASEDVWSFVPPEKMSLPPISPPPTPPGPAPVGEARPVRARRLGPVGVRKGGARTRAPALARLLRRVVATGGAGVEVSPRGVRGPLGGVRAAWQPACAGAAPRSSLASNSSTIVVGSESGAEADTRADSMGRRVAPASPPLLRRRYSVPETVMRRYRLAREVCEAQEETHPLCALRCAPREWVRRSALLRRLGGAPAPAHAHCDTRSLDGSRAHSAQPRHSPDFALETALVSRPLPVASSNDIRYQVPDSSPTADILEIVVSETSPAAVSRPTPLPPSRLSDCNLNIDEYVSNILVDSLNSLTDRLESMTVSINGGDGRISVVEKEIKVKLQNKGVNTVVHLSPTSNNQIIFGNRELCERDALTLPPERIERLFCDEFQASAESWCADARAASPCASLVDSLDDPASPRAAPPPPPPPLPPPLVPVPSMPPPPLPDTSKPCQPTPISSAFTDVESYSPQREKCESFFIRMDENNCACEKENIVVADHMPEKIKQRLYRRHRRREMRALGARRGAARRNAQRDVQRQCAALVDALVDDAIARVAREEHRCARIARHRELFSPNENSTRSRLWNGRTNNTKGDSRNREESKPTILSSQAEASPPADTRERAPPRRLYHKSEIHDGGKCIEILEIVEYANTPRSSSETNSDESLNAGRGRRSRIPVPIQDKTDQQRVRRASVASSASPPASATAAPPRRASMPAGLDAPPAPGALRFERVFDVIPEERSSVSVESAGEEPRAGGSRRSAATSPLAPPGSTSGSLEGISRQKERGQGRRTIGTQWMKPVRVAQNLEQIVSDVGSEFAGEEKHSSSDCECESGSEALGRATRGVRRRARGGLRARRPRPRPAPPPPSPPPKTQPPPEHALGDDHTSVANTGDGWSLTLAGSCRAALPSRLDLRLRFPPRGAPGAPSAPNAPTGSSRSDANTDRYSDAPSQDREWATCKHPPVKRCVHAPAALRYDSTGEPGARRRSVREPRAASPATLPALAAPPPRALLQARGGPCHCCAGGTPATGGTGGTGGSTRGLAPPAPATARRPCARLSSPRLDRLQHTTLPIEREPRAPPPAREANGAGALAVLGCAIVPTRRAAPPTASQRDLRRAARALCRAAARRHSLATDAPAGTRCFCYTYT